MISRFSNIVECINIWGEYKWSSDTEPFQAERPEDDQIQKQNARRVLNSMKVIKDEIKMFFFHLNSLSEKVESEVNDEDHV